MYFDKKISNQIQSHPFKNISYYRFLINMLYTSILYFYVFIIKSTQKILRIFSITSEILR